MFSFHRTPLPDCPLNCEGFIRSNKEKVKAESPSTCNSEKNLSENARAVFLEVTNHCNFRCHFCPLAISKRPAEHMDTGLAKNLIQQLHEAGYRNNLYFHLLGEPLLHPDMLEILRFATKRTLRSILFTNGSLLTRNNIESVFDARPHELMISMQPSDEQTFSLTGSWMRWDEYVSRIRDAVHYKLVHNTPTLLRISVGIRKEDSVYPQDDYFPHVSPSSLRANLLRLFSHIQGIDQRQVRDLLSSLDFPFTGKLELASGVSVSVKPIGNWRRLYADQKVEKGYCPHFGKEFGILSNGNLVWCHLDYDGKTTFANARYDRLRDIFRRPSLLREIEGFTTEGVISKGCQHCVVPSKLKIQEGS